MAPEFADAKSVELGVKFAKELLHGTSVPAVLSANNRGVSFYFRERDHALKITVGPGAGIIGEVEGQEFPIPTWDEALWIARTFTWHDLCKTT